MRVVAMRMRVVAMRMRVVATIGEAADTAAEGDFGVAATAAVMMAMMASMLMQAGSPNDLKC